MEIKVGIPQHHVRVPEHQRRQGASHHNHHKHQNQIYVGIKKLSRAETSSLARTELSIYFLLFLIINCKHKLKFDMRLSAIVILVLSQTVHPCIHGHPHSEENGKFHEEEFGIEDSSKEGKFETKAHYAPNQHYVLLGNGNSAKLRSASVGSRPSSNVWQPS